MKTLAILAAFATFIAAPAFAQPPSASTSNAVSFGSKYVGQDPDIGIRSQLKRDSSVHTSGE